jgi:hypothetical protein
MKGGPVRIIVAEDSPADVLLVGMAVPAAVQGGAA